METILQLDKDIFLFLNNLGTKPWDDFWLFMTHKLYQIPLYVVLLFLFYKRFGVRGTLITLVVVALMIAASDQLSNLFKNVLFRRTRPCRTAGIGEYTRMLAHHCGRHGYFSAHAASSMALAFFTGLVFKKQLKSLFPFMILWSLIVSYSRIYVGVHYPGDIITGIIIGMGLGYGTYKLHQFLITKYATAS